MGVDALRNSKASFLGIFLMSFMIGVSLRHSPVGYIHYHITAYAFYGILSVLLSNTLCSHPVAAWRASMFFSITRILAVIFIDPNFFLFPIIMGLLIGLESQFYWRPKNLLDVKEIKNERRPRFVNVNMIVTEIIYIVMPVVLGVLISGTSYESTAFVVLGISTVQFILALCFKPTTKITSKRHSLRDAFNVIISSRALRGLTWIQFLRGFIMTGCAYEVVAQLNIYQSSSNDIELGSFQSIGSVSAIILLLIYRKLRSKNQQRGEALVFALLPPFILLPLSAVLFPGNFIIAIALYVYEWSVIQALYTSTVFTTYHQNVLKDHVHDDVLRIGVDIIGEIWLCTGRVLSFIPLLLLFYFGYEQCMLPLIIAQSIIAPIVVIMVHKFSTSQVRGKLSQPRESAPARRR